MRPRTSRSSRRALAPIAIALAAIGSLAACGSDGSASDTTAAVTTASGATSTDGSTSASSAPEATTGATDATDATDGTDGTDETTASTADDTSDTSDEGTATKPSVEIPDELPTKLEITDLVEGTGEGAKVGDTVTVNYVGVRSEDGTEFDNSYDRGSPFPVTLGQGSVIEGWEQGLLGIKAGGRRQLDIPADLAYGDNPQGDVIKAGDALTFVIDAVSVTPAPPTADPADKPDIGLQPNETPAKESSFEDLVVGDGDEAVAGSTAAVQLIVYRADTAEELQSTWETGQAVTLPLTDQTLDGFVDGIIGMKVGGRRQLTVVPADAFGDAGQTDLGLPPGVDMIVVVDLVQVQPAG